MWKKQSLLEMLRSFGAVEGTPPASNLQLQLHCPPCAGRGSKCAFCGWNRVGQRRGGLQLEHVQVYWRLGSWTWPSPYRSARRHPQLVRVQIRGWVRNFSQNSIGACVTFRGNRLRLQGGYCCTGLLWWRSEERRVGKECR